jgi:hypothetical protein
MSGPVLKTAHPCGAVDGVSQSSWMWAPFLIELGRGATGVGEPVDADQRQHLLVAVDGVIARAVLYFGSCVLSLHRPHPSRHIVHAAAYLSTRVARCLVMEPCRRIHAGDPGPTGPGLCRIEHTDFRGRFFHAVGE